MHAHRQWSPEVTDAPLNLKAPALTSGSRVLPLGFVSARAVQAYAESLCSWLLTELSGDVQRACTRASASANLPMKTDPVPFR